MNTPARGTWRVVVDSAKRTPNLRLRARLEGPKARPRGRREMLPNLKLVPPFEFTFANPYYGYVRSFGTGSAPVQATGITNCWFDEQVEHNAVRCLRFSTGPINAGEGPLLIRFEGNGSRVVTPGRVDQIISLTDGSTLERYAGEAEFHKTHMHYHHSGFGRLELMKVLDARRGTMTRAGVGPKQRFCTADVIAYEWTRFAGVQNEVPSPCYTDSVLGSGACVRGDVRQICPSAAG